MNQDEYQDPLRPDDERDFPEERAHLSLPDDLPPVEPPSAGLIVQLFLVPAVIVVVIVGVYALFGQLASQELDWRQLVTDVKSENPHVRWRGALGLAQMLDADAQRTSSSQNLKSHPEIAAALAELYGKLIQTSRPTDEELKQIEFLSKALGRMDVADEIIPVLRRGMAPERDRDVRKHSLIGAAMLAGQVRENGGTLDPPGLTEQLIDISRESEPLFRHQAAYILGLIASPEALDRLEVLLEDPNQMARANAAIGFARNGSTQGLPVFRDLLDEGIEWQLNPSSVKTQEQESVYFERMLMLTNTFTGIRELEPHLDAKTKQEFVQKLTQLAENTRDAVLRTEALQLMHELH